MFNTPNTIPGGIILPITTDELRQTIEEAVQAALCRQERTEPATSSDDLLTVDKAVNLLDVTRQTLRVWERQGRLQAVRIGRRVYYRRADIDAALRQGGEL